MGIIEALVRQSGKPSGIVGRLMVKIMNQVDSGLNKWILEKIDCPNGNVLDIGCGGGETIWQLLKNNRVNSIMGIDYSLDAVRVAEKKNAAFIKEKKAVIKQGTVTALSFPDDHFDIIVTVRSHYFWEDHERAFAEIFHTLKPGGRMMVFSEQYKIQYHMKQYNTDDSMTHFLKTLGFINIIIENKTAIQCITAEK